MARNSTTTRVGRASKTRKSTKKVTDEYAELRRPLGAESDDFVFAVCERFFKHIEENMSPKSEKKQRGEEKVEEASADVKRHKGPASAVAEWLAKDMGRPDLNREKIYPLVWEAFRRKFLLLHAPIEKELCNRLIEAYDLKGYLKARNGDITVVNATGSTASQHVGSSVAEAIVEAIYEIDKEKKEKAIKEGNDPSEVRVHIGFGGGYAAMEVARRLSTLAKAQIPHLTLHAISPGGFYVSEQPKDQDPTTYFTYFNEKSIDVQCVGFFAPPVVEKEEAAKLRSAPALLSCFERRNEIDIIVTSLASAADEHGLLLNCFSQMKNKGYIKEDASKTLRKKGMVGDLLFQPYSEKEPISPETIVPFTLFDYKELVKFSQTDGKRVFLIGGPCRDCAMPKTEALRPLLTQKNLRLWTHLTIDRATAMELIELAEK